MTGTSTRQFEISLAGFGNQSSYSVSLRRVVNLYTAAMSDINSFDSWDMPGTSTGSTSQNASAQWGKFNGENTVWRVNVPNLPLQNGGYSSWRYSIPSSTEATYGTERRFSCAIKMLRGDISSLGVHNNGGNASHVSNQFTPIVPYTISGVISSDGWYRLVADVSNPHASGQNVGIAILTQNIEFLVAEPQVSNSKNFVRFLNAPYAASLALTDLSTNSTGPALNFNMSLGSNRDIRIQTTSGVTGSQDDVFYYAVGMLVDGTESYHIHKTYRRDPIAAGATIFIDWADTESYTGTGTTFTDLTGAVIVSTSTTSTSTTSTSTTTAPPSNFATIGSQTAYGGAGYGGTANYKGGTSSGNSYHRGCNGAGGASPLGGNGPNYSSQNHQEGSGGRGATGGGYTTAGVVAVDSPLPSFTGPTETAILNASGYGNGGGGIENNFGGWEQIGINSGNGSGGLVRITIITGGVFTSTDLTNFNATRIINAGKSIEWDNSAAVRSDNDPWHNALLGTFTMPGDSTVIEVGIIAGGGGGSIGPCSNPGGGGGGAAIRTNWSVTAGTTFTIRVGAGGQGGITLLPWQSGGVNPHVTAPYRGGQTALFDSSNNKFMYATGGNVGTDNCSPSLIKYSNNADMPYILDNDQPGAAVVL